MPTGRLRYKFDDVIVQPDAFRVEKSGIALALEPKSIRLLLYLIENRTRAVSKKELIREVWENIAVTDNALTRVVALLRKALGDDVKVARYVETIPTLGYRFVAEVSEVTEVDDNRGTEPKAPSALGAPPWAKIAAAAALALACLIAGAE
jgi:DNA-binding winged helix-turn-helix (wHTH) protein